MNTRQGAEDGAGVGACPGSRKQGQVHRWGRTESPGGECREALPVTMMKGDVLRARGVQRGCSHIHTLLAQRCGCRPGSLPPGEGAVSAQPGKPLQAKRNQLLPGGKTPRAHVLVTRSHQETGRHTRVLPCSGNP